MNSKLQFFGFGADGKDTAKIYGHTSAAYTFGCPDGKEHMLIFDCGPSTWDTITELGAMNNVKEVVGVVTHPHAAHIYGFSKLMNKCRFNGVKFHLLKTPHETEHEKIKWALTNIVGINEKYLQSISLNETKDLFNLQGIETELIKHVHNMQSIAYTLNEWPEDGDTRTKLVYATDHNDEKFVRRVIKDPALKEFFTDCSSNSEDPINGWRNGWTHAHMPYEILKKIIREETSDAAHYREVCSMITPIHLSDYELLDEIPHDGLNRVDSRLFMRQCFKKDDEGIEFRY